MRLFRASQSSDQAENLRRYSLDWSITALSTCNPVTRDPRGLRLHAGNAGLGDCMLMQGLLLAWSNLGVEKIALVCTLL